MLTERGDGVASIKRRRHDLRSDGVSTLVMPSEHGRPKGTLEDSGLCTENPIHRIKYFLSIVDHIQANVATRDASRLHFFYFTLKGKAKEWLDKMPPGTITSWEQIVSKFLGKFFPPERTARILDKILRFCQSDNESLKDAWKRFQDLLYQAPHHEIKKWLLVQLFYDNMIPKDKEKLNQFTQFRFISLNKDERAHQQLSFLTSSTPGKTLKSPFLICDICGEAHEAYKCDQVESREQECLSGWDIYDDPLLLKFY
ncbi:reverse transcriptase domain-containing protein [Tanacetum coccineum]